MQVAAWIRRSATAIRSGVSAAYLVFAAGPHEGIALATRAGGVSLVTPPSSGYLCAAGAQAHGGVGLARRADGVSLGTRILLLPSESYHWRFGKPVYVMDTQELLNDGGDKSNNSAVMEAPQFHSLKAWLWSVNISCSNEKAIELFHILLKLRVSEPLLIRALEEIRTCSSLDSIDCGLSEEKRVSLEDSFVTNCSISEIQPPFQSLIKPNFSFAALRQPQGQEAAMLAAAARARRLLALPAASGFLGNSLGPCRMPLCSSLNLYRGFSTTLEDSDPSEPKEKYLTAWSEGGVDLDTSACTTLGDLFRLEPGMCFYNYKSSTGKYCFSDFTTEIFRLLAIISYKHAIPGKKCFNFDASKILIKCCGKIVLDVLVSETQLGEEATGGSIYMDTVTGPLASFIFSLHLRRTRGYNDVQDTTHKEICDLLELSIEKIWWAKLDDILDHALFWKLEKKLAAVSCAYMWMHPPKRGTLHVIKDFKRVRRKIPVLTFRKEFSKNFFYLKKFTVKKTEGGEFHVTHEKIHKDWKQEFIAPGFFHKDYEKFGKDKDDNGKDKDGIVAADAEEFIRHIVLHFGDNNFDVFKSKLARPTLKHGLIELDRTFYVSLTVFHVLREMNLGTDVLDIDF